MLTKGIYIEISLVSVRPSRAVLGSVCQLFVRQLFGERTAFAPEAATHWPRARSLSFYHCGYESSFGKSSRRLFWQFQPARASALCSAAGLVRPRTGCLILKLQYHGQLGAPRS